MKAREWGTDCSPYDRKERCLPPLLTVLCNSEFPLVQHSSLPPLNLGLCDSAGSRGTRGLQLDAWSPENTLLKDK